MPDLAIPGDVVVLLRSALYTWLARAGSDLESACSLEDPGDVAPIVAEFDRTRALLDAIGWDKQQADGVEVDLAAHGQTITDALADELEHWQLTATELRTTSEAHRELAGIHAHTVETFLAGLEGTSRRVRSVEVACSDCEARPGKPCVDLDGEPVLESHPARVAAAQRATWEGSHA